MRTYFVGKSLVSAMTQTPASAPLAPVTTPPMALALTAGCALTLAGAAMTSAVPISPAANELKKDFLTVLIPRSFHAPMAMVGFGFSTLHPWQRQSWTRAHRTTPIAPNRRYGERLDTYGKALSKQPKQARPALSKDIILAHLATHPGDTKRDLARVLNVRGSERQALKQILSELKDEGAIEQGRKKSYVPSGELPEVAVL